MKIAFDATSLAFEKKTGTGVYCEELIKSYEKNFSTQDQIVHTYRLSRRVRGSQFLRPLSQNISRGTLLDPLTAWKGFGYDIFHGLNTRLPVLWKCKKVASIHDLFSIFGEYSGSEFKNDQAVKLKNMVDRADHIIASCTHTRNQLVESLSVPSTKVSVVLLGVKDIYLSPPLKEESSRVVKEKFSLTRPYLFYTGALEKRKNIVNMISGFGQCRSRNAKDMDIVLAGHPGFEFEKIDQAIKESGFQDRIKLLGFVSEKDLLHLYKASSAFVFPSWAEGFGMPALEAMALGTPVITSKTTSLPEATGQKAWYVDPSKPDQLAATIDDVLTHDYAGKVAAGQTYAREQTWDKVALLTRSVYARIVNPLIS